jgi:predicted aspartyl protease
VNLTFEGRYASEPTVPVRVRAPLTGREVIVDAIVDTGSNVTMLEAWMLDELGLAGLASATANVTGVGGVLRGVALAEVELGILLRSELTIRVEAGFLPAHAPPVGNLLGTDVLEQLDFGLSHSKRNLYFGVPD